MELTDEPDELAAAILAEEQRQLVRVRRRWIIAQLAVANDVALGAGVTPRRLRPTALTCGGAEAVALCREIVQAIEDNLDAQLGDLRAEGLAAERGPRPQTSREFERREADLVLQRRQLEDTIARRTTAARQLQTIVLRLRPRIDPVAVRWWRTAAGDLAGRVRAVRAPGQPPVTYVLFDEGRVLLAYDAPHRWLAVIAAAVGAGAEAELVLTAYQSALEQAMPAEAASLPEYLAYRGAAEKRAGAGTQWEQPADRLVARFDPSEARILHQRKL